MTDHQNPDPIVAGQHIADKTNLQYAQHLSRYINALTTLEKNLCDRVPMKVKGEPTKYVFEEVGDDAALGVECAGAMVEFVSAICEVKKELHKAFSQKDEKQAKKDINITFTRWYHGYDKFRLYTCNFKDPSPKKAKEKALEFVKRFGMNPDELHDLEPVPILGPSKAVDEWIAKEDKAPKSILKPTNKPDPKPTPIDTKPMPVDSKGGDKIVAPENKQCDKGKENVEAHEDPQEDEMSESGAAAGPSGLSYNDYLAKELDEYVEDSDAKHVADRLVNRQHWLIPELKRILSRENTKPPSKNKARGKKRILSGRELTKTYARETERYGLEYPDVIITTDESTMAEGIEIVYVNHEDIVDALLDHPGAHLISEFCGPCFDEVTYKSVQDKISIWYTSTPVPLLEGYTGGSYKVNGNIGHNICLERIQAKANQEPLPEYPRIDVLQRGKNTSNGFNWSYGRSEDEFGSPDCHTLEVNLRPCGRRKGLYFTNRFLSQVYDIEECYPGLTSIPCEYSGSFMENIFRGSDYKVNVHLPSKSVNKCILKSNGTTTPISGPALHRMVSETLAAYNWLISTGLDANTLCGRVNTALSKHIMMANETLRNNEEPEWFRNGGLSQHVVKRFVRYMKPKIFCSRKVNRPKNAAWSRPMHIRPAFMDDKRCVPYGIAPEHANGGNHAVEVLKSEKLIPVEEELEGQLYRCNYVNVGITHTDFSTSISNAPASLTQTYNLRATKKQKLPTADVDFHRLWAQASGEMISFFRMPTRERLYNRLDELNVSVSDSLKSTDPANPNEDYEPSVNIVGTINEKLETRGSDGKIRIFNVSKGMKQWFLHMDSDHQRTYTDVLKELELNEKLREPPNVRSITNKVFVKVEVALRSVEKSFRPRLIQYMEPQYALHVNPMAWVCYQSWQEVSQSADSPYLFTGGMIAHDVESRVREFLKTKDNPSTRLRDNVLILAGGDDNLCFLNDKLDLGSFDEAYSKVGRDPDVLKHISLYSASYCSMGFFRWHNGAMYVPRLMLLPFKQLMKLWYVRLDNRHAGKMASGENVDDYVLKQLGQKAISAYYSFAGCPFMEPIIAAVLNKCGVSIDPSWSEQQIREFVWSNAENWNDKHYKVDTFRVLTRSAASDESMWASYESRYGVSRDELLDMQEFFITFIGTEGLNTLETSIASLKTCIGIDLGSVDKHEADYSWAPEGNVQCIEVDCGSYDASTNQITHCTNINLQRNLFGNHYFIDALDTRCNSIIRGENKYQCLTSRVNYQMLSGHADTTFGNTCSNFTEMIASLLHSYPILEHGHKEAFPVATSTSWFNSTLEFMQCEEEDVGIAGLLHISTGKATCRDLFDNYTYLHYKLHTKCKEVEMQDEREDLYLRVGSKRSLTDSLLTPLKNLKDSSGYKQCQRLRDHLSRKEDEDNLSFNVSAESLSAPSVSETSYFSRSSNSIKLALPSFKKTNRTDKISLLNDHD